MIRHGMDLASKMTQYLNPGQVPVMCVDQPLFALVKSVQWEFPGVYGESDFVSMLGPFNIEQSFLRVIGNLMEGSGWAGVDAK